MQVLCKQIAWLCKTRNSVDEWYPTAYGLVTNTHSSIMSIKLLCGVFLCVPYPCYATCSTLNKDSFTANHMLARPGKDGAHFRSRWGGVAAFLRAHTPSREDKWGKGLLGLTGSTVWKSHRHILPTLTGRTIFSLQVNMIHHQLPGYIRAFCPEHALPNGNGGGV